MLRVLCCVGESLLLLRMVMLALSSFRALPDSRCGSRGATGEPAQRDGGKEEGHGRQASTG